MLYEIHNKIVLLIMKYRNDKNVYKLLIEDFNAINK